MTIDNIKKRGIIEYIKFSIKKNIQHTQGNVVVDSGSN